MERLTKRREANRGEVNVIAFHQRLALLELAARFCLLLETSI